VVVVMYFLSSFASCASSFPFAMLPYSSSCGPNLDDVSLDPRDVGVPTSAPRGPEVVWLREVETTSTSYY